MIDKENIELIEQSMSNNLDVLIAESETAVLLDLITKHIKNLEHALGEVKFLNDDPSFTFSPLVDHQLGYDFANKRIICVQEVHKKTDGSSYTQRISKPLLEHKISVRKVMFQYLPDLLTMMRKFR